MKGLLVTLIALFIYLSVTLTFNKSTKELEIDEHNKQIIFFSKETHFNDEASYYDALIELKNKYPTEINNMMIISSKDPETYFEQFEVSQCPAIVVVYKNKVITRIDGEISKEKILEPLEKALSKES